MDSILYRTALLLGGNKSFLQLVEPDRAPTDNFQTDYSALAPREFGQQISKCGDSVKEALK